MDKKSFVFGMGIGILFITFVFLFVYRYQKNILLSSEIMSEQEIVSEAKKLGMSFFIENTYESQAETVFDSIQGNESTDASSANDNQSDNQDGNQNDNSSNEIIVENNVNPVENVQAQPGETAQDVRFSDAKESIDVKDNNPDVRVTNNIEGFFKINIPEGYSSGGICNILAENGVIANARDFDKFLSHKGFAGRLIYGEKIIPYNSDYYQILQILTSN